MNLKKMNLYTLQALKSGILGFSMILVIIFFAKLTLKMGGYYEKFAIDFLDLLLATVGFILKYTEILLKNILG
jgi:hypothetical protein